MSRSTSFTSLRRSVSATTARQHVADGLVELFAEGRSFIIATHMEIRKKALKKATRDLLASANDKGCTVDLTVESAFVLTKEKDIRKDSLIERDSGMGSFFTDVISWNDASNA